MEPNKRKLEENYAIFSEVAHKFRMAIAIETGAVAKFEMEKELERVEKTISEICILLDSLEES